MRWIRVSLLFVAALLALGTSYSVPGKRLVGRTAALPPELALQGQVTGHLAADRPRSRCGRTPKVGLSLFFTVKNRSPKPYPLSLVQAALTVDGKPVPIHRKQVVLPGKGSPKPGGVMIPPGSLARVSVSSGPLGTTHRLRQIGHAGLALPQEVGTVHVVLERIHNVPVSRVRWHPSP